MKVEHLLKPIAEDDRPRPILVGRDEEGRPIWKFPKEEEVKKEEVKEEKKVVKKKVIKKKKVVKKKKR